MLVIDEVCCAACGVQGGVDFDFDFDFDVDVDADEVLYVDLAALVAVGVVADGGAEDMVEDGAVALGVDEADEAVAGVVAVVLIVSGVADCLLGSETAGVGAVATRDVGTFFARKQAHGKREHFNCSLLGE